MAPQIEPNLSHRALTVEEIAARPDRVCPVCLETLDPSKRSDAVYCGDDCRDYARVRRWRNENRDRFNEWSRDWQNDRYADDPEFRETKRSRSAAYRRANPDKWTAYYAENRTAIEAGRDPFARRAAWQKRRARLRDAIDPANPVTAEAIRTRWAEWDDLCYLCGDPATETDHIVALSAGGPHIPENLAPVCGSCNRSKGPRSLDSFYARKAEREISETGKEHR